MPKEKIGDIEMYYQVQGQGDPLVLIQGLTMDYTGWLLQSSVFSDKYKVVVFDNRGVGRTSAPEEPYTTTQMADDTAGLLDFLKIEKAHVLGLSLGGMIAQELAINHPDRLKSLILAGTAACPREGAPRSAHIVRNLLSMAEKGADLETCTRMFMAWAFTPKFFENPDQVQMVVRLTVSNPFPQPLQGLAGQVSASFTHDTRDRLDQIKAPTMVLVGSQDLLLNVDCSKELAEKIPNAELKILQGTGHFMCFEHAELFNQAVLEFLAEK
jgi:pimeloyl-ACP methyl ester carboxylesterase